MGIRITRIKLVNFIGIMHGLNRSELEIDFTKNAEGKEIKPSKYVMLNGSNGSGKTTILSQLQPFKDSFDERKTLVISGEKGLKEIDYEKDGVKYTIQHHYSKKGSVKSYIQKDGKEMNENGGIRTFVDIVENELDIDQEYFKIGRIGSNVTNFSDQSTGERKKYIANIAPSIEAYLKAFDTVKKKFTDYNTQLRAVAKELEFMDSEDRVQELLEGVVGKIEVSRKTQNDIIKAMAVNNSKITDIRQNYKVDNIQALELEVSNLKVQVDAHVKSMMDFKNNFPNASTKTDDLRDTISSMKENIVKKETKIESYRETIREKNKQLVEQKNQIVNLQSRVKDYADVAQIPLMENELQNMNKDISLNEEVLSKNPEYKDIVDITDILNSSTKATRELDGLERFFLYLKGAHDFLISEYDNGVQMIDLKSKAAEMTNQAHSIADKARDLRNDITKLESLYASKLRDAAQLEILDKRPKNCVDDNCPFISNALQFAGLDKELNEMDEKKRLLDKEADICDKQVEALTEVVTGLTEFNTYMAQLANSGQIYTIFLKEICNSDLDKYIKDVSGSQLNIDLNNFVADINNYLYALHNVENMSKKKQIVEGNLKNIKDNASVMESLTEDIRKAETTEDDINKSITEINNQMAVITAEVNGDRLLVGNYENALNAKLNYKEANDSMTEKTKNIAEIYKKLEELNILKSEVIKQSSEATAIEQELVELEREKTAHSAMLIKIKEYRQKKEDLTNNFDKIKTLKESLDPNKGIPLYFINLYLQKIQDSTNELLDIAYKDELSIGFEVTSKDFFIKVNTNGDIKDDIKLCSQGEISIINISLSLALIEQSLNEYNILSLDEIDGPLDPKKRREFINIIEAQMDNLNIEQSFIISHNNAFDSCDLNLILLEGSTVDVNNEAFMSNKEIIFQK